MGVAAATAAAAVVVVVLIGRRIETTRAPRASGE